MGADTKKDLMIVIRHTDGASQEGVLLSLQSDTMRIAGKGSEDVLEFRLIHGNWVSEDCDVVTFEFPLAVFEAIGMVPPKQDASLSAPVAEPRPIATVGFLN
jgi:hypothetical protein